MGRVSRILERGVVISARLIAVMIGLIFGAVITVEMLDRAVVIEEISVPTELSQQGYTPSVVAYQILNEWRHIDQVATTTRPRPHVSLARGEVEMALSGVNISISSIVDYLKSKAGMQQPRLRGGVVISRSEAPECLNGCYTIFLNVDGRAPSQFEVTRPRAEIDGLLRDAARSAAERLDPYLLANYYFASSEKDEPHRESEVRRLVEIVLKTPPADDDRWALTLSGVMLNRKAQWAEAIGYFDRALAQDSKLAAALNSRCWARAHLPGLAGAAIADCREALKIDPKSFETMDSLAFALEQNGQLELAFATIKCARRISGGAASVETTYARLRASIPGANPEPGTKQVCAAMM